MLRSIIASAAALSALLALSFPASAEQVSVRVEYRDLNLASSYGQQALDGRIEAAVKTICGEAGARDTLYQSLIAPCQREVRATARPQVTAAVAAAGGSQNRLAAR